MAAKYEEVVGPAQLTIPDRELTPSEIESLWILFEAIQDVWSLNKIAPTLKTKWLDLLVARGKAQPSYRAEFINAAAVAEEIRTSLDWQDLLFFQTIVTDGGNVQTRLQHAKFFVVNDFLRCFILSGGFESFGGRNYPGFMGGSRFASAPPVRVGARQ